ncbi:uncharacterized protein J4E87_008415 [Alternaria ethzedia]|uniref:uncharacterized protein n=1 Tax=Alternaria ethzedia TaxID=181014 RepID=UPI0020C4CE1C|nr:uncharacterized protein J4E87_008415 [Alternaria ethzedia]KAI4617175.1 hypothetical protein J4E87_008415 [Alternaria ethzedia]
MASEDHYKHARLLYARLKAEAGDYPHWNGLHIYDMIKEGVSDEHIKAEWSGTVLMYQDSSGGAADVFSRLSRFGVTRHGIDQNFVAEWMEDGMSERTIALQYLLSPLEPTIEDVKACLAELQRQMGPCPSMTEEYIRRCMEDRTLGEDLAMEYAKRRQEAQLADQTDVPRPMSDEDLWFELHYGLLYATTKLPSEPVVLRHPRHSVHQYKIHFNDGPGIDDGLFNAKTRRLARDTVMRLDWRLDPFIKAGGHPIALRTTVTSDHLAAYRKIRKVIIGDESNTDVESHSVRLQFLMDLAAKLHPNLASPPMQSTDVVAPVEAFSKSLWTEMERHALWRAINRWCKDNGVDQFESGNIGIVTCQTFADDIKADCAIRGRGSERSAESVQSQVKDAMRRAKTVANKPITELALRAKAMKKKLIDKGVDSVPKSERFPKAAIDIPGDNESDTD